MGIFNLENVHFVLRIETPILDLTPASSQSPNIHVEFHENAFLKDEISPFEWLLSKRTWN